FALRAAHRGARGGGPPQLRLQRPLPRRPPRPHPARLQGHQRRPPQGRLRGRRAGHRRVPEVGRVRVLHEGDVLVSRKVCRSRAEGLSGSTAPPDLRLSTLRPSTPYQHRQPRARRGDADRGGAGERGGPAGTEGGERGGRRLGGRGWSARIPGAWPPTFTRRIRERIGARTVSYRSAAAHLALYALLASRYGYASPPPPRRPRPPPRRPRRPRAAALPPHRPHAPRGRSDVRGRRRAAGAGAVRLRRAVGARPRPLRRLGPPLRGGPPRGPVRRHHARLHP